MKKSDETFGRSHLDLIFFLIPGRDAVRAHIVEFPKYDTHINISAMFTLCSSVSMNCAVHNVRNVHPMRMQKIMKPNVKLMLLFIF